MGILTLEQDGKYVISSDRGINDVPVNKPPKARPSDYHVWTGDNWSLVKVDATTFDTLDAADEFVKANYPRLSTGTPRS